MTPVDRHPTNFRELILAQFEPDIAAHLIEFGKLISRIDVDFVIFMARKSLCLYDVLVRIGVPPTEKLVLSDRVLDMTLDRFRGKHIALIDDTLILGTTLAKTKATLLNAGAATVSVHVFCIDQKWWCKELIRPDSCMLQLPDQRVMTFCAATVRAMSLIPRPYLVDFPLSKPIKIRVEEEQCFLSNLDWRGFNISTSLQERHGVSSMSFFPIGSTREAMAVDWGANISALLDIIKVRAFARRNRDVYWLQIVPIVVMKPVTCEVLDQVLEDIVGRIPDQDNLDLSEMLNLANTPRSRQRLVQYILSCIVGNRFTADSELSSSGQLPVQFDSVEADRHYGPWLSPYLLHIAGLKELRPQINTCEWVPAQIPNDVLVWSEESLKTEATLKQEENDTFLGSRSLTEVRNILPAFSDIFVRHYDTHEIPTREAVLAKGAACLQAFDSEQRDRLETGLTWGSITKHLHTVAHLAPVDGIEDGLSLALDFCNDQGIAVPVTSVVDGVVFRAYRHGEDVKFTDAEVALAYQAVSGYLSSTGLNSIPRLRLEKLLVMLMKVGIARGFMEPLFLTANGVQEVLRIGFYLHGAIPMLQRGPKDRADRDMWFSDHLRHKQVITRAENGQYSLGKAVDGNFRVTTAPDDAYELGSIIGMLSKPLNGVAGPLDDRALTLLTSCSTPRHTAAAVQVELDIFARWYEDYGRTLIVQVNWDDITALQAANRALLTSKGYYAVNEARLKFLGYHSEEPRAIIVAGSQFLANQGNGLAQRKWDSYWNASKVFEAPGEREIFDKELKEAITLCWEVVVCLSAMEISFRARMAELDAGDDRGDVGKACQKLFRYGDGLISAGLLAPRATSQIIDRLRQIELTPSHKWDSKTAMKYAQTVLEKTLPRVARQVEIMNPLIEEYGRLLGRRDYTYMVYYDIMDSTATKIAAKGLDIQAHRSRVRTLKQILSRGFDKLSQAAQKRASEVFCWNGAETSSNDCKHVFIGGTDSTTLLQETIELLVTSLRAAPGQRIRIYAIPCGFAGSTAYRTQWETEVSGERFWEHWSRLAKAAKPLEESISDDHSFLLVASSDLINRLAVHPYADWVEPIQSVIRSEIEGLVRETPVQYGAIVNG